MTIYHLKGSVGLNGRNLNSDVKHVQVLLNRFIGPRSLEMAKLVDDGIVGNLTREAIRQFQVVYCGFKYPDRRVDPGKTTYQKLKGPIDQPRLGDPHEVSLQSVIATLRDSRVSNVKLELQGEKIDFQDYNRVAKRCSERRIMVYHDQSKGNSAEYFHKNEGSLNGYMLVGFREAHHVLHKSIVVHEATHAALDLRGRHMFVDKSEALSYLAQAMYYYSITGGDFVGKEVGPSAAVLTQAIKIARRIRQDNNPRVTAQEETDLFDLVQKLPTVKPGAFFAYDG